MPRKTARSRRRRRWKREKRESRIPWGCLHSSHISTKTLYQSRECSISVWQTHTHTNPIILNNGFEPKRMIEDRDLAMPFSIISINLYGMFTRNRNEFKSWMIAIVLRWIPFNIIFLSHEQRMIRIEIQLLFQLFIIYILSQFYQLSLTLPIYRQIIISYEWKPYFHQLQLKIIIII